MKKSTLLVIGIVALLIIGGVLVWLIARQTSAPSTVTPQTGSASQSSPAHNQNMATTPPQSGEVNVTMQDLAFTPTTITIKKGTKVTWTNNDSVRHNVVADATNAAGLPTENDLFGKNGTYSFTFNSVGTVKYHCTAHPFMTGTVEVVD